jgi:streptogramin lyase
VAAETSGIAFSGATLLPNGQVVFTPYDSANVGVIDTFSPVSQEFCLSPYFNKF